MADEPDEQRMQARMAEQHGVNARHWSAWTERGLTEDTRLLLTAEFAVGTVRGRDGLIVELDELGYELEVDRGSDDDWRIRCTVPLRTWTRDELDCMDGSDAAGGCRARRLSSATSSRRESRSTAPRRRR